ncbi:MAG TPA: BTAD domain-containing putative transcriptional regulator, partial [Arenibaculum sp.]|nr:BTAD domain-containing putative transcriptional regulator [Arenibaculum sp.]
MAVLIQLLGGVSASIEGRPVTMPTRKAAGLLALLATRPGIPLSRDRVCGLLWSRSPDAQARTSLRQALSQLRQAMRDEDATLIEATTAEIRLVPDQVDVDLAILEEAIASEDPDRMREAAALFRGDFLDGFLLDEEGFEEWRRGEMRRIRERVLLGLGKLLGHMAHTGDTEAGIELGERLLALEPTSEEIHRALMRLYIGQGAVAAAVRQYERCRVTLEDELGVPPSAETETLRREISSRPRVDGEGDPASGPSIAVLPFVNLSEDAEQAYFAQGFAEDVLRELARFPQMRTIAWHSSSVFRDSRLPSHEIGRLLGADYLLVGSVRRMARTIRIGVELVEARTGRQVWTTRHDAPLDRLFEIQDDVAIQVAVALHVRIGQEALKRARSRPIESLQAYDCWLRGIACLRTGSQKGMEEARALFRRAIESDPHCARAYAGLSLAHFNDWSCIAWDRWDDNEQGAFENAKRAVELDESDHVAQFILGRILLYRRAFEASERHLERAFLLNGNDADILTHMALAWTYLGRPEQALEAGTQAIRLNPFHDDWYFAFAAAPYFVMHRLDEAIPLILKAPDIATDIRAYLAAADAHTGRMEEARRQVDVVLQRFRQNITFGREPRPGE